MHGAPEGLGGSVVETCIVSFFFVNLYFYWKTFSLHHWFSELKHGLFQVIS